MVFFLIALFALYVGRKIGWALSKRLLYTTHVGVAAILCTFWGALIAYSLNTLIAWQHPGLILKVIMGYALGCYVAIPNFGLLKQDTILPDTMPRHMMISWLPLIVYVLCNIGFAYF
jgi:hypothetical protein